MEKIVGIDTVIFIYLLEENPLHIKKVQLIFSDIERGKSQGIFSVIGLIELLTGPKKQGDYALASQYRDVVTQFPHLTLFGINEHIVELSSELRARYGIATPDAIHLATAIDAGARSFITNDKALKKIKEIPIRLL